MRSDGAALAVLVLAVVAASCGSGTMTTTVGTSAVGGPDLAKELLSVEDLPVGWSVDNSSSSSSNGPDCFQNVQANFHATAKATGRFNGGANGVPFFEEDLGYFGPGNARSAVGIIDQAISGCKQVTFDSNGYSYSGTMGVMSFPSEGDESNAYQLSLTANKTLTIGFDIVVIRKTDTLAVLFLGDLGSPDVDLLHQLADKAVSKL